MITTVKPGDKLFFHAAAVTVVRDHTADSCYVQQDNTKQTFRVKKSALTAEPAETE